jgi:hypothetical protein
VSRARTALAVLLVSAAVPGAWACPVCFGQSDGPMIDATRVGLWLLLGVTLGMQGAFVAFFLYLRRQAARARDRELDREWSALQVEWPGRSGGR